MNTEAVNTEEETISPREARERAAEANLAKRGLRRSNGRERNNDRVWDWLIDFSVRVRSTLASAGVLLMFNRMPGFDERLKEHGKYDEYVAITRKLADLTTESNNECRRLIDLHKSRRGSSADAQDMFACISISHDYVQLADRHRQVGGDLIAQAIDIASAIGVDTNHVRLADGANSTLVAKFVEETAKSDEQ